MNHLIVARYQEDVSWLDTIEGWEPLVVTKDVDIPNEGRECSSFMFGLASVYTRLGPQDRVACVQGDPFAHCPDLTVGLAQPERFVPLGNWHTTCDLEGNPHHPGLPIVEYWTDWTDSPLPDALSFTAGGQWVADADVILARPVDDYRRMVGEMSRPWAPWVMERLWSYWLYPKEST